MNRTILKRCALVLAPLLFLVGCVSMTATPVDTLSGVLLPVCERHDAYALALGGPENPEVVSWLTETNIIRNGLAQAQSPDGSGAGEIDNAAVKQIVGSVTGRHDAWVQGDPKATELQKRSWLRSAAQARELVEPVK